MSIRAVSYKYRLNWVYNTFHYINIESQNISRHIWLVYICNMLRSKTFPVFGGMLKVYMSAETFHLKSSLYILILTHVSKEITILRLMCWFISSKLYNFVLHDTSDVIVHLDTPVTVYMYISVWLYIGVLVLKKINWRKYKKTKTFLSCSLGI